MLMEHFLLLTLKKEQQANNVFFDINKRSLGSTPQDAIVYGSKMYIAIYGSNIIEIVDKNNSINCIENHVNVQFYNEKREK